MNVGLLTMEKADNRKFNSVGSSRIRGRWVAKYWNEAEEYIIGKQYDAMIFQKVYWRDMLSEYNGIKVLDLCDPDWLEGKPVMEYVNMCDATVTSTEALAEYIRLFTDKPVVCIPDRLDLEEHKEVKTKHLGNITKAVWFGYSHNDHYIRRVVPFLAKNNIELRVISNSPYNSPPGYGKLKHTWIEYSQNTIHKELVKSDVAILPDPSTVDAKGKYKSNNKDVTCWALGLPVIKQPEDIDRLQDPEERKKEAKEKRKFVEDNYDVKISVQEWKDLLNSLKK